MNERIKELAEEAGYYLYDLTETHECKTVETDSTDEWITLEKFAELIRADEREACAKVCEDNFSVWTYPGSITREECAAAIRSRGEVK